MGMTFTREQQQVIDLRNRNLLVSAAAGSGKTAVLVERIISKIMDENHPVDIDRLLIVTFTKAAAAEMRERIGDAIDKRLNEQPENTHLQRQQTLLYNAQITTIDSFCLYVIRNYFHKIDLEPDFRVGEEGELKLLSEEVLDKLLDTYYEANSAEFIRLSETIATGKNDEKLKETIQTLYTFAMSDPWPKEWLMQCLKPYQAGTLEEFEKQPLCEALLSYLEAVTGEWIRMMETALEVSQESDGPQMYAEVLADEVEMLKSLKDCGSYQTYARAVEAVSFGRLPAARKFDGDEQKKQQVQELRNAVKDSRKKLMEQFFFLPPAELVAGLKENEPVIRMLLSVTADFMDAFLAKKQEKNMLDFSDLEHFALEILVDKETKQPTQTAVELRKQFEEVMIDEYQDSNYVQEALLAAVAGADNRFMVGDVKQSIYRFRMARPELFMEKYDSYASESDNVHPMNAAEGTDSSVAEADLLKGHAEGAEGCDRNWRIDLHKNFRSRPEVLRTVNDIFYRIMAKDLGNVEYDAAAALYPGMEFPESSDPGMFQTEVLLADPGDWEAGENGSLKSADTVDSESMENGASGYAGGGGKDGNPEAVMIAEKIRRLMEEQQVTDKQTGQLRSMEYRDVVILLRGIGSFGQELTEVLKSYGIPAMTTAGTGYFSAIEVQTVLNLLRLLDNPRQDIPMAAVLKSHIGGISEEEMAKIRIAYPDVPFYQSVFSYAGEGSREESEEKDTGKKSIAVECGEESGVENVDLRLQKKLQHFLNRIADFRGRVSDTPIHELLYQVMEETGYLDYVYALPGGPVRRANLMMLLEKAIAYEKTSYHGLFHFIRYINELQKYEVDFAEAEDESTENAVRIMTIHKSKGLEFPVVIVAGMGRLLNQQDARNRMVLHPQYGIGLDVTDLERRVRIPSLSRQILARQIQMENAGEELRVLYVALTRAREKLILTGTMKKAAEKLSSFAGQRMDEQGHMGFLARLKAGCYFDWVLPALLAENAEKVKDAKKSENAEATEMKESQRTTSVYKVHQVTPLELMEGEAEQEAVQALSRELLLELAAKPQPELLAEIAGRLFYHYPYEKEQELKTKLSVSELKHRAIDQLRHEESDTAYAFEEPELIPYIPDFMREATGTQEEENIGALRGTAMHRVLECFDFSKEFDTVQEQVDGMAANGRLEQRLYELVSLSALKQFFRLPLASRMQKAARAGQLHKEKPFVMGKRADEVSSETDSNAMVLIQGIIDAFFEEDGELVLVDYKTDAVKTKEELIARYRAQMDLYQEALERAVGKRVKEKILYSFKLREEIVL